MKEKKWVHHISGQGEKWEVVSEDFATSIIEWQVYIKNMQGTYHWLPKSEYRLCDPPEVWKDVSSEVCDGAFSVCKTFEGYRLRKVTLYAMARPIIDPMQRQVAAFIVEQKVTE